MTILYIRPTKRSKGEGSRSSLGHGTHLKIVFVILTLYTRPTNRSEGEVKVITGGKLMSSFEDLWDALLIEG